MNLLRATGCALCLISLLFCAISCRNGAATVAADNPAQELQTTAPLRVPTYTYEVINSFPHDPAAFTQGLVFHQGVLYESTGLNGQSSLRKVDLLTGQVLRKIDVPAQYFAEGLVLFGGRAIQLTWQSQVAFIYDQESFQQLGTFAYTGEGWGLTHNGTSLIMSDGTNRIRFLDPQTFQVQRTINVQDRGRPIDMLNELEYVKGEIFANVWLTDRIARINPQTGAVNSWLNLAGLLQSQNITQPTNVLNGIAYDAATDRLFVTGKLWPRLFEIRVKLPRNEIRRQ